MNTLFKSSAESKTPVLLLPYREIESMAGFDGREPAGEQIERAPKDAGPSPEQIDALVKQARVEGAAEAEKRLRKEYEEKLTMAASQIKRALEQFTQEQRDYFARVEAEVVRLALSVASRILHREAQVEPMLVATLVRIAIEKMHEGSNITVRVAPAEIARWREYLGDRINGSTISFAEDPRLSSKACVLETELGSADFSIEAQLKEVEQGFFDLLAQRPEIK